MTNKKNFSIVTVISNLTKGEALELKAALINKSDKIAPRAKHFASTGDGSNIARAITNYESKRITDRR
jgi:hypothetical protein